MKPHEFWTDGVALICESKEQADYYFPEEHLNEPMIHVIEYSAYAILKKALQEIQYGIESRGKIYPTAEIILDITQTIVKEALEIKD